MFLNTAVWIKVMLAILIAFVVSFALTPVVKILAQKLGAMDVPGEARRVHDHPIPRMGGLAIFLGFIVSMLLFVDITQEVRGILLGSIIIVITGVIDDIISLRAWTKFLIQILAAVIAVLHGVVINVVSNPNVFSSQEAIVLGWLAIPLTVLWIVGITNSVNLIDGLDGLAVGVSTISCVTILVVALLVSEPNVALIVAALAGACIGFMPYNLNPARIFMGDTGSLLLGYVLSTVSVLGLFKFYAIVTFVVPVLALAVPPPHPARAEPVSRRPRSLPPQAHGSRSEPEAGRCDPLRHQRHARPRRRRAHDEGLHPHRTARPRAADRLCRVRLHPQERTQAPHRRGAAGGTGRSGRAGGSRSGRTGKRRRVRRNTRAGGQR